MAHIEQQDFFKRIVNAHPSKVEHAQKILEIGSQNINGTVRDYFPNASEYLGLDLGMADCVDWVIPGELVELPDSWADISISTECFEHCSTWREVFTNMIRITKESGLVIVTCAGIGRSTHGTIDSDEVSSPFTTSYYKNLSPDDFLSRMAIGTYFDLHSFEINSASCDLYFWGIRSKEPVREIDHYWEDPIARLARAQGQLAQAAARHSTLQKSFQEVTASRDHMQETLNKAIADAERAKADAERAKVAQLAIKESLEAEIKGMRNSLRWRIVSKAARLLGIQT